MPMPSAAVDYRSTHAATFPTLPAGMTRSQVEALLVEVAPALCLSGRRLQALLVMMGHTRPQAWTASDDEPVCYASQTEIAAALGKSERAVRADEDALSRRLGLIEKRTAANGARSRSGGLGLVFSRLIELVPQLLRLRDRLRAMRARTKTLVRLRSAYFRHLRDGLVLLHPAQPDDPQLCAIRDAMLAWPASGTLRGLGLDALERHVADARALCDDLDAYASMRPDSSGQAVAAFRCYTEDTSKESPGVCNADASKRHSGKPENGHAQDAAPNRAASCKEQNDRAPLAERKALFLRWLGPDRLYTLAGPDLRLCLDMACHDPTRLREIDFVTAAVQLLPHLGISGSAWTEAVDAMGDFRAALCVLVTDANRDHPITPVRKPGGHLRALTRRHQAGQLNLAGSLIGLAERRKAGDGDPS